MAHPPDWSAIAAEVAPQFAAPGLGAPQPPRPLQASGDTLRWSVRTDSGEFRLERIDPRRCGDPAALMANIERVVNHMRQRLRAEREPDVELRTLQPVSTSDGRLFEAHATSGSAWRMFDDHGAVFGSAELPGVPAAEQLGRAFGEFHRLMAADFPWPPLIELGPSRHDTPAELVALQRAQAAAPPERLRAARDDSSVLQRYPRIALFIEEQRRRHLLPERVIHGDCCPSRLLRDPRSGALRCIGDLDTVTGGTLLCDFGDLARLALCNVAADEPNAALVELRPDMLQALAGAYLQEVRAFISDSERRQLISGVLTVTLGAAARALAAYFAADLRCDAGQLERHLSAARVQTMLFLRTLAARSDLEALLARL